MSESQSPSPDDATPVPPGTVENKNKTPRGSNRDRGRVPRWGWVLVISGAALFPLVLVLILLALSSAGHVLSGVWPFADSRLLNHDDFGPAVWVNLYGGLMGSALGSGIAAGVALLVLRTELRHERERAVESEKRQADEQRNQLMDDLGELLLDARADSTRSDLQATSARVDRVVSRFNRSFSADDDRGMYLGTALSWGAEVLRWITRDQDRFDQQRSWLFDELIPAFSDVTRVVDMRSLARWKDTRPSPQTEYIRRLSYTATKKLRELRRLERDPSADGAKGR